MLLTEACDGELFRFELLLLDNIAFENKGVGIGIVLVVKVKFLG